MDQTNNVALSMLQTIASQAQMPKAGKKDGSDGFQKLMDKATTSQSDRQVDDQAAAEKPAATTPAKKENPAQNEEDPIEASKRLQVYLVPVSPEELAQYPAEWLPQVQEGEPIVCIGVHTGKNGEQIPTLVGASTAEKMYGKDIVAPWREIDVSDPKADAMLEATAPGADNSPAAMLEKLTAEQFGKEIEQTVENVQPQETTEDDPLMEITDAEQAPQKLFHDVKAVPVKVGEVYDAEKAEQPNVAKQVDAGLAQALKDGESMVRIQLNPEHLGSVTVEITQSAEGIIHVALSARSSETRGLLERHAGELQGLIANRTQQSVEVDVQRQQESQQNQNQQNYDGHNGHAQDGQEHRRRQQEPAGSQDFVQQLRLGLIPTDGDEA